MFYSFKIVKIKLDFILKVILFFWYKDIKKGILNNLNFVHLNKEGFLKLLRNLFEH